MDSDLKKIMRYLNEVYSINVSIESGRYIENYVDIAAFSQKNISINSDARDGLGMIFIIAHLFGHMVQFSDFEKYRSLVETSEQSKPNMLSNEFRSAFYLYELEAYEIGKALIVEALGKIEAENLDQRFQIYHETDFETYWAFLVTGKKCLPSDFNHMLSANYLRWNERFLSPLRSGRLPSKVEPMRNVIVY